MSQFKIFDIRRNVVFYTSDDMSKRKKYISQSDDVIEVVFQIVSYNSAVHCNFFKEISSLRGKLRS